MTMHPPAIRRCQIYDDHAALRCRNDGTHWVRWFDGGGDTDPDDPREDAHYSWECDGACDYAVRRA